MAINEITQEIASARVDARSLSEFVFKPSGFKVTRRLAPSINTLNYYIGKMSELENVQQLVNDAIDATVIEGNDISSSLITVNATMQGAVSRTLASKLRDHPTLKDFGVIGDGIANDTTAVMAFHIYCNEHNITAEYSDVKELILDSNAQIPINTNVNFNNIPIRIVGRNLGNEGGWDNPQHNVYIVADSDCPLLELKAKDLSSTQNLSDVFKLNGYVQGSGFAYVVFNNSKMPPRYTGEDLMTYSQAFKYTDSGVCNTPVSAHVDASDTDIWYRLDSKRGYLKINNPCLIQDNKFDVVTLLSIERNQVEVSGFSIKMEIAVTGANSSSLVNAVSCSEFKFTNFSGSGVKGGQSAYILGMFCVSRADIRGVSAIGGWGWIGSNHLNDIRFDRCFVNRIDVHAGAHNIEVTNSALYSDAVQTGWSGGYLLIENCESYGNYLYRGRADYYQGNGWRSLTIRNIRAYNPIAIAYFPNNRSYEGEINGGSIQAMYQVGFATFENIEIVMNESVTNSNKVSLYDFNRIGSAAMLPPLGIKISNIISKSPVNLDVSLSLFKYRHDPLSTIGELSNKDTKCTVILDDIECESINIDFGSSAWTPHAYRHEVTFSNIKSKAGAGIAITSLRGIYRLNILNCKYVRQLNIPLEVEQIVDEDGITHTHTTQILARDSYFAGYGHGVWRLFFVKKPLESLGEVIKREHCSILYNNIISHRISVDTGVYAMQGNLLANGSSLVPEFSINGQDQLTQDVKASYAFYGWTDIAEVKIANTIPTP